MDDQNKPQQEILSTAAIVGIAIQTVNNVIEMFPNYEQRVIQRWKYLRDMYEIEKNKPRAQGAQGRSNPTLLNLRDELLRYGEVLVNKIRQEQRQEK